MFPVFTFHTGTVQSDSVLPCVTASYIKSVLSAQNLASAPGAAVVIPENVFTEKLHSSQAYVDAGRGFRSFYVAIGGKAQTRVDEDADGEDVATISGAGAHEDRFSTESGVCSSFEVLVTSHVGHQDVCQRHIDRWQVPPINGMPLFRPKKPHGGHKLRVLSVLMLVRSY